MVLGLCIEFFFVNYFNDWWNIDWVGEINNIVSEKEMVFNCRCKLVIRI